MSAMKAVQFPRPQYANNTPQIEVINMTGRRKASRRSIKWDRIIVSLIILISLVWALAKPAPRSSYIQAERRIKAIEEYNRLTAAKFKNDCWMNKSLRLPLSPSCQEALQK